MVQLTKSVGRMAFADSHDVAAVQAALANVKIRTKFGRKPVWPGKIDGRNSKDLESAIAVFQGCQNIKQSGKAALSGASCEPGEAGRSGSNKKPARGPTINALSRTLSASFTGQRGLPGSIAVYVPGSLERRFM